MSAFIEVARRMGWGIADQALSSLTNFGLGLAVARNVNTESLGIFTVTFATYLVVLGLSRPVTTNPLVIRYSTSSEGEWRQATRAATGTAAAIGALFGMATVLAGWLIGGSLGTSLMVLGVAFPGLVMQETWRFAFFARSRGSQAFVNDLIWLLAIVGLFSWVFLMGRHSVTSLVAAWGAGASVAAVAGAIQARILPAPRLAGLWHRHHGDLYVPLLGEAVVRTGTTSLSWSLIAVVAGLEAVGALKGADILLGPTNVMVMGLGLVAVPECARSLAESPKKLLHTMIVISSIAGVSVLAWGVVLLFLPASVGKELLGVTWAQSRVLLVPMTIAHTADAITTGAISGLLALAAAGRVLRTRSIVAVIFLCVAVPGAAWAGASGAASAFAFGTAVISAIWWRQALKALRERAIPRSSATSGPVVSGGES